MLPDGPNTSESQRTLPALTLAQKRLLYAPQVKFTSPLNTRHLSGDDASDIFVERIFIGIYYSNQIDCWTPDRLRSHGFTHIVHIDRHLRDECKTAPKDIREIYSASFSVSSVTKTLETSSLPSTTMNPTMISLICNNNNNHIMRESFLIGTCDESGAGDKSAYKSFITLDLNFGEKSFLTTVLPNCYKAVKFIDKALQVGGAILVIDQLNEQKCLTVVIGYLMYKHNLTFCDAYQRIKRIFKKADLEPFFIRQLYEYEPILQVERAQSRGQSCSREMRSAQLKRKKMHDDSFHSETDWNNIYQPSFNIEGTYQSQSTLYQSICENNNNDVMME